MAEKKPEKFILVLREAWAGKDLFRIFYECWKAIGADPRQARKVYEDLHKRYNQAHRRHHVWFHIEAGIGLILEIDEDVPQIAWVILAYFFHDAIFDPQKDDNEERSAQLCVQLLTRANASLLAIAAIRQLIMLTDHQQKPWLDSPGKQCIVSVDLVTIGASPANFQRYWDNLRYEYAHLSDEEFQQKQKAFLWTLYRQDVIFTFSPIRVRYEEQARKNILALHQKQTQTAVN